MVSAADGHVRAGRSIVTRSGGIARPVARAHSLPDSDVVPSDVAVGDVAVGEVLVRAWQALDRGRPDECRRLLASARASRGVERARVNCLAALSRCVSGDHRAAIAELTAVLPGLDGKWAANALVGRGTAAGYLLRLTDADADFAAAADIYRSVGEHRRAAACLHNRGFVALRAGDVALAVRRFDEAGLEPGRHPEALVDRAQALIVAGLTTDARALLTRASTLLAGRGAPLAETMLALAQCALRAGQPEVAARTANEAAAEFRRQGRPSWRAAARAVEVTARGGSVRVVRQVADECDRYGWAALAAELRVRSGHRSLWAAAAKGRHTGPARIRALGWLARAMLAQERCAVSAACRAGFAVARRDAGAGEYASALAEVGLRAALWGGQPRSILRWADRAVGRSGPARPQPDRPGPALGSAAQADAAGSAPVGGPFDNGLAAALAALRSATVAGAAGRVRRLERQIRTIDATHTPAAAEREWTFAELFDALGDRILVRFVAQDGRIHRVSCMDGQVRGGEVGGGQIRGGAVCGGEIRGSTGNGADRELVVVPAPTMWSALPSWPGRAVSIAPSVGAWLRACRADAPGTGGVWLAGPGLRHAAREARSLQGRHGGELRVGRAATAATAMAAMDGADLVHIAAHGRFRAAQPLFSSVELSGGPLFGYDVRRLVRPPRRVVLAACDAGRAVARSGGEAVGMALAFLYAGTATVIASTRTVPDRLTTPVVTALHDGLARGLGPARALAEAQTRHGELGFICLGAG